MMKNRIRIGLLAACFAVILFLAVAYLTKNKSKETVSVQESSYEIAGKENEILSADTEPEESSTIIKEKHPESEHESDTGTVTEQSGNTAMESESSGQNERTEETMPVSGKETPKETETTVQATSAGSETTDSGSESAGSQTGSAEENAREDATIINPENETIPIDLSGDNWENDYYRCDEDSYEFIICNLSDPRWYANDEDIRQVYYNRIFALSDRYRKEHPFSEGSFLKPYYPDIDDVYWFNGSFDERKVVLEAYDTSHKRKFFRIRFTITENYELDTVTVEELSDDDVAE